jgi:hypothetical protein
VRSRKFCSVLPSALEHFGTDEARVFHMNILSTVNVLHKMSVLS